VVQHLALFTDASNIGWGAVLFRQGRQVKKSKETENNGSGAAEKWASLAQIQELRVRLGRSASLPWNAADAARHNATQQVHDAASADEARGVQPRLCCTQTSGAVRAVQLRAWLEDVTTAVCMRSSPRRMAASMRRRRNGRRYWRAARSHEVVFLPFRGAKVEL
jgi:hypothetical protein